MKKFYKLPLALLALIFSTAISAQNTSGVLVLNEGSFGVDNAGMSFLANGQVHQQVYADGNNNVPLGNTAQSMAFDSDHAYVILNGSNALKVLDKQTLALQAIMPIGLFNPRFITLANGNAYITCWGDGGNASDDYVAVVDLQSLSITTTIPAPEGVERIIQVGDKLYVANQGGYGYGNTVSVIDVATNTITATIQTGDVPNSIISDGSVLYVLCGGKPMWATPETFGKLMKFNLADNSLISEINFEGKHPSNLELYGDFLLFSIETDIYKITLGDTDLPENPLFSIDEVGSYGVYGMDVIGDQIYVADAADYVSNGKALVYNMNGVLQNSYTVGVIPNGFYAADVLLSTENPNGIASISVFPNPTTERFFINTDKNAAVKIYDISGRLVKSTTYNPSGIVVSDLNSGIYLVEITINDQKSIKRISIK
ncbi:hypothetical protein FNO01nite_26920 [Flavobacterium noncentrifugens]|uniref:Por secretion system C-terminal sorting domain-containing protein n=1 Tax=Flavobacterium noncentrifugens TaxID=1128970 RepID=A0A1G9CGK7_9FLAO|nr:DUF5074 domain-containing protein [Flavobacterium noncentrifugens]GEP52020.1 hypothetical protein FNO01nite_26920 [Flavobacterium noncentrifugens]SDK50565.1 Por secretion system C-terminal sorting domain-containing protein [Flavobacterium noncentrifugens]